MNPYHSRPPKTTPCFSVKYLNTYYDTQAFEVARRGEEVRGYFSWKVRTMIT